MKYIRKEPLRPNVPLKVVETDDAGNILAHYRGYWRPRSYTVTLYPDHVVKPGYEMRKKTIADIYLRLE